MNRKPSLLLALLALAALATPTGVASNHSNECNPTGTHDSTGRPIAPPCLTVAVPNEACTANRQLCLAYYVFLIPDNDGDYSRFDLDDRIVWQETNGCAGLQRTASAGCAQRDKVVFV